MIDNTIRVGLIDDHPVVREGLRMFLESAPHVVITVDCGSGDEALEQMKTNPCDVIVLDLVLRQGLDGVATFERITRQWPETKVLILTSYRDAERLRYLHDHGAAGYLDKTVEPDDLLEAIRLVAKGRFVWDTRPQDRASALPVEPLTSRESGVLDLVAEGLSNKEIAQRLNISEKTVKVHISHILAKLNVYDRTQAVIVAHQIGLIRLPSRDM